MDMEHAKTYQITPEILNEISQNLSDEPPNIVKTLHTLLDSKKLPEPFPIIDEVKYVPSNNFSVLNVKIILATIQKLHFWPLSYHINST